MSSFPHFRSILTAGKFDKEGEHQYVGQQGVGRVTDLELPKASVGGYTAALGPEGNDISRRRAP